MEFADLFDCAMRVALELFVFLFFPLWLKVVSWVKKKKWRAGCLDTGYSVCRFPDMPRVFLFVCHLTGLFLEHQQFTWLNPVLSTACFSWRFAEGSAKRFPIQLKQGRREQHENAGHHLCCFYFMPLPIPSPPPRQPTTSPFWPVFLFRFLLAYFPVSAMRRAPNVDVKGLLLCVPGGGAAKERERADDTHTQRRALLLTSGPAPTSLTSNSQPEDRNSTLLQDRFFSFHECTTKHSCISQA